MLRALWILIAISGIALSACAKRKVRPEKIIPPGSSVAPQSVGNPSNKGGQPEQKGNSGSEKNQNSPHPDVAAFIEQLQGYWQTACAQDEAFMPGADESRRFLQRTLYVKGSSMSETFRYYNGDCANGDSLTDLEETMNWTFVIPNNDRYSMSAFGVDFTTDYFGESYSYLDIAKIYSAAGTTEQLAFGDFSGATNDEGRPSQLSSKLIYRKE